MEEMWLTVVVDLSARVKVYGVDSRISMLFRVANDLDIKLQAAPLSIITAADIEWLIVQGNFSSCLIVGVNVHVLVFVDVSMSMLFKCENAFLGTG